MFAKGLPDRRIKKAFPTVRDKMFRYVIQEHLADKAGKHFDFRISDGDTAYSWATKKGLPTTGNKHLFIRQPDHTPKYMSFQGVIKDGYGKGKVSIRDYGAIHVLTSRPEAIKFNIYMGSKTNQYTLISTGADNWLCINVTPTSENRPLIPLKKPKALSKSINDIDFKDTSKILMPKIDGSASVFLLKKDKPVEVFSYRKSKRGPELINRTYKYPDLYNKLVPSELDGTVIWGESFVTDSSNKSIPHRESVGLLNSGVSKALAVIKDKGYKFDNVIFNVDKFKNKKVNLLPYSEKLTILKKVHKYIPSLKLPEMAVTSREKRRMYEAIKDKRYPTTSEGYVEWDITSFIPTKAKIKEDTELYVQDFEEGKGNIAGSLGKIIGTPDREGYGPKTRVGGGFTNAERSSIWENREKYKGLPIKIEYQEKLPNGKYRMPIFKSFRTGEFWPT